MGPIWDKPGGTQMGNIWKCPYGSNMGIIWETQVGNMCKCPYGFIMGSTWVCPNGKQMWTPIWVSYGNTLGKHKWEINVNTHMGHWWVKPGGGERKWEIYDNAHMGKIWETLVGNLCKCPYGFFMGSTWGHPNGKHIRTPIWVIHGTNLGETKWEIYQSAHMGQLLVCEQSGQTLVGKMCKSEKAICSFCRDALK